MFGFFKGKQQPKPAPKPPEIPVVPPEQWPPEAEQDCVLRKGTGGRAVDYDLLSSGGTALEWVLRSDPGAVRVPEEKTEVYPEGKPFTAAGRQYLTTSELRAARKDEPSRTWYLDRYGRKVFYVIERYPCFDSYDLIHENRYHRWYFLCEDGALTRIYKADDKPKIYVTEDVAVVENLCWEEMEKYGYPERR